MLRARTVLKSCRRFVSRVEDFDVLGGVDDRHCVIQGFAHDGFLINSMYLLGSCVVFPRRSFLWSVERPAGITFESLSLITHATPRTEILVLGTGPTRVSVSPELTSALKARGIVLETMDTRNAVGTFNILNQEGRKVAAALLPLSHYERRLAEL